MRAVLDPNTFIAALLTRSGAPAQLVSRWLAGEFELVVSDALIAELERAFAYPKVRRRVTERDAKAFVAILRRGALLAVDPAAPARRSADAGDDYLVALAEQERALLVSGDEHLLALDEELPVQAPRDLLTTLAEM